MTASTQTILVLTNDAGLGHRKAANATVAAIEQCYGDHLRPILANPIDDHSIPAYLRNLQTNYSRIVSRVPAIYSFAHDFGNHQATTLLLERMANRNLLEPLRRIIERIQPDVIVTTHPVFVSPLVEYRHRYHETWPIVVLVTDLARLQRLWFRKEVDLYLVPTQEAAKLANHYSIRPENVRVTGVPVDLRLAEAFPTKTELRADFGWFPNLPAFIIAGSRRVHDFLGVVKTVNRPDLPIQLVVVTGDAEELLDEIRAIDWHIPAHIYGFVHDFPLFLRASDAIITKAGGLTVAESLAAGVPLFITQSLPLYERGNAAYVTQYGAGLRITEPGKLADAIQNSLADNGRVLREMSAHAAMIGRPRAAYEAAEQIWTLFKNPYQEVSLATDY